MSIFSSAAAYSCNRLQRVKILTTGILHDAAACHFAPVPWFMERPYQNLTLQFRFRVGYRLLDLIFPLKTGHRTTSTYRKSSINHLLIFYRLSELGRDSNWCHLRALLTIFPVNDGTPKMCLHARTHLPA